MHISHWMLKPKVELKLIKVKLFANSHEVIRRIVTIR